MDQPDFTKRPFHLSHHLIRRLGHPDAAFGTIGRQEPRSAPLGTGGGGGETAISRPSGGLFRKPRMSTSSEGGAIGCEAGLRYVTEGNVPGEGGENTYRPGRDGRGLNHAPYELFAGLGPLAEERDFFYRA